MITESANINSQNSPDRFDRFIEMLRQEASALKDCFTKFSFQAILFTGAMFGLIATFTNNGNPYYLILVHFACASTIILLLIVARINLHKYSSSNRHFGYELFLNSKELNENDLKWETMMMGWRIIQSAIFKKIYDPFKWHSFRFREKHTKEFKEALNNSKIWFKLEHKYYYAGSYLGKLLTVLHLLSIFIWIFMIFTSIEQYFFLNNKPINYTNTSFIITIFIVLFMLIYIFANYRFNTKRLQMIESGILCIYSCSVIWSIVNSVIQNHYTNKDKINLLTCLNDYAGIIKVDKILTMNIGPSSPPEENQSDAN